MLQISWKKCSNHSSLCPTGHTCCYSAEYPSVNGCCEGNNAVCCNDMHHCCPENYICDSLKATCTQTISTYEVNSIAIRSPDDVVCRDGITHCPDKTTCCLQVTKSYGCCGYPEAKCCEDQIHCCPHGYNCDPNSDKCVRGDSISPLLMLHPQKSFNICPDEKVVCTMNETCCKQPNDSWACCPLPDAVCCDLFCCPKNSECGPGYCKMKRNIPYTIMRYVDLIQGSKVLPSMKEENRNNIDSYYCPNDKTECTSDQICCGLGLDNYGCCPGTDSMCCSDGQHCCPNSYKCLSDGRCIKTKY